MAAKVTFFAVLLLVRMTDHNDVSAPPVDTPAAPKIVEDGVAVLHEAYSLTCVTQDPSRKASYLWFKDFVEIHDQSSEVLHIANVTEANQGVYTCAVKDVPSGTTSGQSAGVELRAYSPAIPRPGIRHEGIAVVKGTFDLYCVILDRYNPVGALSYTWFRDSRQLSNEARERLHFSNVTQEHRGAYSCAVKDGNDTSPPSPTFPLRPLMSPGLSIKSDNQESVIKGVLGENLTLTCEVTEAYPAVPPHGYQWSYVPFSQERRPLPVNSSTLTLERLTLEHRGHYSCQANNDQYFKGVIPPGHASVTVDIVYLDNITLTPEQEVNEGDTVTFTCEVTSLPPARLSWIVRGQEVRHVTHNVDHYILTATCADGTNYTCRAANADMPGREITATSRLNVKCDQAENQFDRDQIPHTVEANLSAFLEFKIPRGTSTAIVHPSGQDIIALDAECSYNVSPAFRSRCLYPHCHWVRHHFSFILASVTEEDAGSYTCRANGTLIPNCGKELIVPRCTLDMSPFGYGFLVCAVIVGICLVTFTQRHKIRAYLQRSRSHIDDENQGMPLERRSQTTKKGFELEELYERGKVYVYPPVLAPEDGAMSDSNEETDTDIAPLLRESETSSLREDENFVIKQIEAILKRMTAQGNLPSFLLHKTRLCMQQNIILMLNEKFGVVAMIIDTAKTWTSKTINEACEQLQDVTSAMRRKLKLEVDAGGVRAILAMPNMPKGLATGKSKRLLSDYNVETLLELEAEKWERKLELNIQGSSLHQEHNADVYNKATRLFLTLNGCNPLDGSSNRPSPAESWPWLLTPAQMEVRDHTAKQLHIWGPPGSGKTMLLMHRARQWLTDGKDVVILEGRKFYDILRTHIKEAILEGVGQEAGQRLHVCETYQDAEREMIVLRRHHPPKEICLIVDALCKYEMLADMMRDYERKQPIRMWSAGSESLERLDANPDRAEKAKQWQSIELPLCLRCTESAKRILQMLRGESSSSCPPASLPDLKVVDHWQHESTSSSCAHCKEELRSILSPEDGSPHWSDWIALYTGNPHDFIDFEPLKAALENLGMPVSYKSENFNRGASAEHNFEDFRKSVATGKDQNGEPVVYLVRCEDFSGMEKEAVVLIHVDDEDDDAKSGEGVGNAATSARGRTEAIRLAEHREQWIQAVSRSRGKVILLLLTRSPARSLLDPMYLPPQHETNV